MTAAIACRGQQSRPANDTSRSRAPDWARTVPILWLLLGIFGAPAVLAQTDSVSITARVGQGSAQADIPTGPDKKVFSKEEIGTLTWIGGGAIGELFGAFHYRTDGNWDPYIAVRAEISNLTDSEQPVSLSVVMPMQPVLTAPSLPQPMFTGIFTLELKDANGDGQASYSGGGPGFLLVDGTTDIRNLTPTNTLTLTEPEQRVVYDVAPIAIPTSPTGQWSSLWFSQFALFPDVSSLSAGDSLEFYVFGCVTVPGTNCPTPPELALSVPEPREYVLLAVGLVVIAGVVRRGRRP